MKLLTNSLVYFIFVLQNSEQGVTSFTNLYQESTHTRTKEVVAPLTLPKILPHTLILFTWLLSKLAYVMARLPSRACAQQWGSCSNRNVGVWQYFCSWGCCNSNFNSFNILSCVFRERSYSKLLFLKLYPLFFVLIQHVLKVVSFCWIKMCGCCIKCNSWKFNYFGIFQESLSLFCETCDKLTCRDCQLTDHRDHKYKFIHEIAEETKNMISGLLSEVR
jgi:hypothetical protein